MHDSKAIAMKSGAVCGDPAMSIDPDCAEGYSAWNPGIAPEIPGEFRLLETIHAPAHVFASADQIKEFSSLTGLPAEELTVFRPHRLALHELILRITADIAVPEGEEEEAFGHNFRAVAQTILNDISPLRGSIESAYAALRQRSEETVIRILAETLLKPAQPPTPGRPWFAVLPRPKVRASPQISPQEHAQNVIASYKTAGLDASDPFLKAVYRSLYRVLGAVMTVRGRPGTDASLLTTLVSQHVCNNYGSQLIGQMIAPLIDAAIRREGYTRVTNRETAILISLKGASAAGKSSLRPMLKQEMRKQGIEPDGYATISPDIWRRMLLDYDSLGPAYKYAGQLTSRELLVIDSKLDRYIRHKANREQAIPHILVDRFRFDSFSSRQIERLLHDTYAKYVDTMYMYFIITPPEETVERGWRRALARGRYKTVADFLGHSVEAYVGMPKLLFKWLAYERPNYRFAFLDNRVPKGTFPKTAASGDRNEIQIYDPLLFIEIERYQKIDIAARSRSQVYPPSEFMTIAANSGFLKECIHRIELVSFVDPANGCAYLRARKRNFEVLDPPTLARMMADERLAALFVEIAPQLNLMSKRGPLGLV